MHSVNPNSEVLQRSELGYSSWLSWNSIIFLWFKRQLNKLNKQLRRWKAKYSPCPDTWKEITLVFERMGAARSSSISTTCSWPLLAPQCRGVRPSCGTKATPLVRFDGKVHKCSVFLQDLVQHTRTHARRTLKITFTNLLWTCDFQTFTHTSQNHFLFLTRELNFS